MPFNVGPIELVILLLLIGPYLWALVVSAMKEQWLWFVLGLFFFLFAFVGAFSNAKPGSAWERRKQGTAI